jgi:transposase
LTVDTIDLSDMPTRRRADCQIKFLLLQIKERFGVEMSERHVGRLLHRLSFTRLSVRPRHPETDEAAQAAFKKTSLPS